MKTLQEQIIAKQDELIKSRDAIIQHYQDYVYNVTPFDPEIIEFHEDTIKEIESELSALKAQVGQDSCKSAKSKNGKHLIVSSDPDGMYCGLCGKDIKPSEQKEVTDKCGKKFGNVYYCSVCGKVPVDAENGYDTCDYCAKNI